MLSQSNGNGTGYTLPASEMSSSQRSALLDALTQQLKLVTLQTNTLTASVNAHEAKLREYRAMLDAHAGVVLRPTLWSRLRWLVTGR